MEKKKKRVVEQKECISCHRMLAKKTNFYNSSSPMFPDGKAPLCKKCIKEQVDYDNRDTIYKILQALDIPFIYPEWDRIENKCSKDGKDVIGNYLREVNSLSQYKGLTYSDSIFDSSYEKENNNSEIQKCDEEDDENKIYSTEWRGQYSKEDLQYLNDYYRDLKTDFKIRTRNHQDYARKIAKASLAMDKAYESMLNGVKGADTRYKNLKDTFDQLSKSAQFAEDKRGQNEVGLGAFGVVFDKVEKRQWIPKHTPIEKDDYDKMIDYFSVINKSL